MITVHGDKIKVNGPDVDGGYSITLKVGQFNQPEVAEIVNIPQQTMIKATFEVETEDPFAGTGAIDVLEETDGDDE